MRAGARCSTFALQTNRHFLCLYGAGKRFSRRLPGPGQESEGVSSNVHLHVEK